MIYAMVLQVISLGGWRKYSLLLDNEVFSLYFLWPSIRGYTDPSYCTKECIKLFYFKFLNLNFPLTFAVRKIKGL